MVSVYLYNDLKKPRHDETRHQYNLFSLLELAIKENSNVIFLENEQLQKQLELSLQNKQFDIIFGIAQSGYDLACAIAKGKKQITQIIKLDIQRKENTDGSYVVESSTRIPLHLQLFRNNVQSVALIDDTIYSGITLMKILSFLPSSLYTEVFCLQAMKQSIDLLQKYIPITAAHTIPGTIEKDATIIRASGLFTKGSIRKLYGEDMAFYQRKIWMKKWFPYNYETIILLCHEINICLEQSLTNSDISAFLTRMQNHLSQQQPTVLLDTFISLYLP